MVYRTRTYIAGDWTGDRDLIDKLYQWNESNYWGLSFSDAHALTQARDSSLPCSIKDLRPHSGQRHRKSDQRRMPVLFELLILFRMQKRLFR